MLSFFSLTSFLSENKILSQYHCSTWYPRKIMNSRWCRKRCVSPYVLRNVGELVIRWLLEGALLFLSKKYPGVLIFFVLYICMLWQNLIPCHKSIWFSSCELWFAHLYLLFLLTLPLHYVQQEEAINFSWDLLVNVFKVGTRYHHFSYFLFDMVLAMWYFI